MAKYNIISLINYPEKKEKLARFFHEKWNIPYSAYLESMDECLKKKGPVPQWYVAMDGNNIVGGLGVIENDFHNRKDFKPNVCAVYVEEEYRRQGIAGTLLNYVCDDMKRLGINELYLLTDHTSFYERYGWNFFCMAQGDNEEVPSRVYIRKL